jgi:hypothetical protein
MIPSHGLEGDADPGPGQAARPGRRGGRCGPAAGGPPEAGWLCAAGTHQPCSFNLMIIMILPCMAP